MAKNSNLNVYLEIKKIALDNSLLFSINVSFISAFWNVIQSSFETSTLSDLYDSLCERIDLDKQVLLSYNNICRQNSSDKLGITLSSYIKAIDKALFFMRQKDSTDTPSESGKTLNDDQHSGPILFEY